jgi:hypothetical protein
MLLQRLQSEPPLPGLQVRKPRLQHSGLSTRHRSQITRTIKLKTGGTSRCPLFYAFFSGEGPGQPLT